MAATTEGGRPSLPRIDTDVLRRQEQQQQQEETMGFEPLLLDPSDQRPRSLSVTDLLVEDRLLSAVAFVLRAPREGITLIDSFTDLGGNEQTAHALRSICLAAGLDLQTTDIMRCRTLAELQTCVCPASPPDAPDRAPDGNEEDEDDDSSAPSAVFTDSTQRHSSAEDLHPRSAVEPLPPPLQKKSGITQERQALESLILATPQVSGAAVIKPKAGFLEDKVVAFVSLRHGGAGVGASQHMASAVHVVSQSQMHDAGSQVAAVRLALESSAAAHHLVVTPSIWIVLDRLPTGSEGALDRRTLQTWAQNMNEDTYRQVTSIDSEVLYQEPLNDAERIIQRAASRALRVPERRVGMNFSFPQLGGDDVSAMLFLAACKSQGMVVRPEDVMQAASLAHVASVATPSDAAVERVWNDSSVDGFRLSPMQQLYFDTATGGHDDARAAGRGDGSYRFNQSLLLRVTNATAAPGLEDVHAAVQAIAAHHAMLRARFWEGPNGWTQRVAPEVDGSFGFGYHNNVGDQDEVVRIMEQAQARIDIENGPVFAAEHMRTADGQQMVFLVAHHLVVDHLSWQVIVHDLDELLRQGTLFSERSMPFWAWNDLQESELRRMADPASLPFAPLPCDLESWGLGDSLNTYRESAEVHFTISPDLTAILHSTATQVLRTEVVEIYMAALHVAFAQTFKGRPPPTIWNQEHGREPWNVDVDVSETVGWLSSLCPIGLRSDTSSSGDLLQVLRDIKDTRRTLSHRGWEYFASRFFGPHASTRCAEGWPFEVLFTFLGSNRHMQRESGGALEYVEVPEQTFAAASSDHGLEVSRMALFEVNVTVERGAARVGFVYNRLSTQQDKIAAWIQSYEHTLYEAIGKLRYQSHELTLADVPMLDTDYGALARFHAEGLRGLGLSSARDIEDVLPVTAAQQDVLISQTQRPGSGQIFSIHQLTLDNGATADQTQICNAWELIVARYPALRTIFIDSLRKDGLFDQVILQRCSPEMLFFDANAGEDAITSLKRLPARSRSPSQPHHRLTVCTSGLGAFLKLEASQAVCDLPSLQLLMAELKRVYNSAKTPMNILDPSHVACVRYLRSARRDDSIDFWLGRLRDTPSCQFPRLRGVSGSEEDSNGPANHETHFDLDITSGETDDFCRKYGVSRGTLMRVAWGLVLRAFTDSSRVCFGFRTSGREGPEAPAGIQQSIGCFENTVPCGMDLWPYQSMEAIVREAEDSFGACLAHQHVCPSEVEDALGLRGGERLFNTSVHHVEPAPVLKSRFCSTRPQMELSCMQSFSTLDYDLSLLTMFVNGHLACGISNRILTNGQAFSVVSSFGRALKAVLRSPFACVGGLDLSGQDNRALLASSPVVGRLADPPEPCVHSLVANRIKTAPEAPAVCAGDGGFSYRAMGGLVQRLASHLIQWGVRPGVAVPVVLGRTKWSVVCVMAVLKAGGCFVPVDGDDRHMAEAVIREVQPHVVLVTDNVHPGLNLFVGGVIVVNEALFTAQLTKGDAPARRATGDDVACVLFPSGSSRSRELRGFTYSHNALSSALIAQGKPLSLHYESRVFQISSFSVDTSIVEILATLVHGGCVCIPTPDERKRDIVGAIRRTQANWMYLTPILARRLQPSALPSLKVACFRTRGLDEDTCAPWRRRVRVILAYGCLEICPFGVSALEVLRTEDLARIGQPFLGRSWIANPDDPGKLVPEGAVGELCIESAHIANRFVSGKPLKADRFSGQSEDGRRMVRYVKTSQRVRQTEDGTMDLILNAHQDMTFHGKVIPSSHIEMHLRRTLGAGIDVVVEVVASCDNQRFLACFLQLEKAWKGPEDLSNLDEAMRERAYFARHFAETSLLKTLPPYMIPSVFIPVRHLPVTSAMKVNRRRLQKWIRQFPSEQLLALCRTPEGADYGAEQSRFKPLPLTKVEERMRSVCARVLGVDERRIDPNLDFSKLGGGGSASAARLVVECRQQGLDISIGDVLRGRTLTEMCQGVTLDADAAIEANAAAAAGAPTSAVPQSGGGGSASPILVDKDIVNTVIAPQLGVGSKQIKDASETSSAQVRSIEIGLLQERGDMAYLVFSFTGLESVAKLEAACFGICVIHPILRTTFVRQGSSVYQVVVQSMTPEFKRIHCPAWRLSSLVDKVIKKDEDSRLFFGAMTTKFFYLDAGKQSTLIVRLSRAQYDDFSVPLFVQDLGRFYAGSQSPPRRSTYYDLVRSAELAHTSSGGIEHWRKLLDGATMTKVINWKGPPSLASGLREVSQELAFNDLTSLGITFDTVVKAAWAIVLANLSGSGDVLFGEVVDGRHARLPEGGDASGIIGPLQHAVPVRIRFGEQYSTPLDLLQSIHDQKVLTSAFDSTGWLDIMRAASSASSSSSTLLPPWTRFSTAIHHQPHGHDDLADVKFAEAACKFSVRESPAKDAFDLLVTTSHPQKDKVNISLTFCPDRVPASFADETLGTLCSTIELLTSVSLMHPLIPSADEFAGMSCRIPFPEPRVEPQPARAGSELPAAHHFALQSLIAAAWTRAVSPRELSVSEAQLHKAAFYDLWGSLIPASDIAAHITRELPSSGVPGADEIEVTMEDIIAYPTMMAQLDLLVRKIRNREVGSSSRKRMSSAAFVPRAPLSIGRSIRRLASSRGHQHARNGSDGSQQGSVAVTTQREVAARSSLDAVAEGSSESKNPPIQEIDSEQIEYAMGTLNMQDSPPEQPTAVLMPHDPAVGQPGHGHGHEPMQNVADYSDGEELDILMPLDERPRQMRYSPEESYIVSPLSPASRASSHIFESHDGGIGLGIDQPRAEGPAGDAQAAGTRTNSMKKRASSIFGKIGLS